MSNAQIKMIRKLSQKKFRNELKLFTREFLSDARVAAL